MSQPIIDRINDNIDRVKDEGQLRSENIRGLLSDVATLTASELKEGTEQMRSILTDAISAVMTEIKDAGSEIPDRIITLVENAIEESTRYRQEAIASLQIKMYDVQAQIDEKQRQLNIDLDDTIFDIKATEVNDSKPDDSGFSMTILKEIDTAVNSVKKRREAEFLKQQYLNLQFELARLDTKLMDRYGDRYGEVKQQLDGVKVLYDRVKGEAETTGVTPIQSKQTEIERKLSKFAAAVAITEHEIVEYLQQLWKDKGFNSQHKD